MLGSTSTNTLLRIFLPIRFLLLFLSLLATTGLFYTRVDIIQVAINQSTDSQEDADYEDYDELISVLFGFSIICYGIELIGILFGTWFIWPRTNIIFIVAHFIGIFFTLWIALDAWTYKAFVVVFVFCTLLPAFIECYIWLWLIRRWWFSTSDKKK